MTRIGAFTLTKDPFGDTHFPRMWQCFVSENGEYGVFAEFVVVGFYKDAVGISAVKYRRA